MGLADAMRTLTEEVRNSRQRLREAKASRLDTEDQRQDDEEKIHARDREKYVNNLIGSDKERMKDAKQLLRERRSEVKVIFNDVNSFLGEVSDDMAHSRSLWRGHFKGRKTFSNGKATSHSKPKKKKRKK